MEPDSIHGRGGEQNFETLCHVAQLANLLAKQLDGSARSLAYKIKAQACSLIILAGGARVNGIWPDGIIALDLAVEPPVRLHVRKSHLTAAARTALIPETSAAPAVERLGDRCGAEFKNLKFRSTRQP